MLYKVSVTGGTIDSWTATNNSAPGMDYMTQNAMSQGKALAPQLPHIGQQFQKHTIQQMTSEASMDYNLIRQNAFADELEKLADQRQWFIDRARKALAAKGKSDVSTSRINKWLDSQLSSHGKVFDFGEQLQYQAETGKMRKQDAKALLDWSERQLASHMRNKPRGSDNVVDPRLPAMPRFEVNVRKERAKNQETHDLLAPNSNQDKPLQWPTSPMQRINFRFNDASQRHDAKGYPVAFHGAGQTIAEKEYPQVENKGQQAPSPSNRKVPGFINFAKGNESAARKYMTEHSPIFAEDRQRDGAFRNSIVQASPASLAKGREVRKEWEDLEYENDNPILSKVVSAFNGVKNFFSGNTPFQQTGSLT